MTAVLAAVSGFALGLFLGWLLTATFAVAAMSRAQERMQRKVRYWQAQTASARTEAERLARLLEAHGFQTTPGSWEELR